MLTLTETRRYSQPYSSRGPALTRRLWSECPEKVAVLDGNTTLAVQSASVKRGPHPPSGGARAHRARRDRPELRVLRLETAPLGETERMTTEQADGSNYRDDSNTIAEDADGSNFRDDSKTIDEDADGTNYRDDSKGISEAADGSNYREPPS